MIDPDILKPIIDMRAHERGMADKLAGIIAKLLNENEPLLKAEHDGNEVIVREVGGDLVFTVDVSPGMLGSRVMRERMNASRLDSMNTGVGG